jgi:hypothetical protein
MIFAIALAATLAFAAAADVYDIVKTRETISKGLAVEANTWLVGSKPSTLALALRDGLVLALTSGLLAFALIHGLGALAWGALAAPIVFGVKHIHGGLANQKVLDGQPAPDPNSGPARSWLYKLIHNW